jgi:hypothetical protein
MSVFELIDRWFDLYCGRTQTQSPVTGLVPPMVSRWALRGLSTDRQAGTLDGR